MEEFRAHKAKMDELSKKIKGFKKKPKKANQEESAQAKGEALEEASRSEQEWEKWKEELVELEKKAPPPLETVHALHDIGSENMKVAVRGNLLKTGEEAPRRFLRILAVSDPIAYQRGSGREELAASVIDPRNPLTARVFVNRVWQHHSARDWSERQAILASWEKNPRIQNYSIGLHPSSWTMDGR